jgi:hypothetical protein
VVAMMWPFAAKPLYSKEDTELHTMFVEEMNRVIGTDVKLSDTMKNSFKVWVEALRKLPTAP